MLRNSRRVFISNSARASVQLKFRLSDDRFEHRFHGVLRSGSHPGNPSNRWIGQLAREQQVDQEPGLTIRTAEAMLSRDPRRVQAGAKLSRPARERLAQLQPARHRDRVDPIRSAGPTAGGWRRIQPLAQISEFPGNKTGGQSAFQAAHQPDRQFDGGLDALTKSVLGKEQVRAENHLQHFEQTGFARNPLRDRRQEAVRWRGALRDKRTEQPSGHILRRGGILGQQSNRIIASPIAFVPEQEFRLLVVLALDEPQFAAVKEPARPRARQVLTTADSVAASEPRVNTSIQGRAKRRLGRALRF